MKLVYLLLLLASALFFILYGLNYQKDNWQEAVFVNMATGSLGTIVTLVFVDSILKRVENLRSRRYASVATLRIRVYLQRHLNLLFDIYKASSDPLDFGSHKSIEEIFGEDFYRTVRQFDISASAPVTGNMRWADYIHQEREELDRQLKDVLDNYAMHLDLELVEAVEALRVSSLYDIFSKMPVLADIASPPIAVFGDISMWQVVEEYIKKFFNVIEGFNEYAQDGKEVFFDDQWFRNDIAPQVGSARLNGSSRSVRNL